MIAPTYVQIPKAFRGLSEPFRHKAYYGGRGSAKSHSMAAHLVARGADRPTRGLCCREIQKSIRDSVKRLLDDKIDEMGLRGFYTSTESEIRGPNGTSFIFAGLRTNPDSIKSLEGIDVAWIEEAHTVSARSLEILQPTIRSKGSEIWYSWNPRSKDDPVDKLFRDPDNPAPPNSLVVPVSWRDNPFFPDVLRQEMEYDKRRDRAKYQHVWEGDYLLRTDAQVFTNWIEEEFETPDDVAVFYLGADWGYANDPTVLVRCFIVDNVLYIDHEAWRIGCEIDNTPALFAGDCPFPAKDVRRWENPDNYPGVPGALKWTIRADSARPETISHVKHRGFNIVRAAKGKGSVEDGIEFLKNYDIVVHPRCVHVIKELTHYSWKVDPHTDEVLPVLVDKENHTIDSLRYAVEQLRRAKRKTKRIGVGGGKKRDMKALRVAAGVRAA